VGEHRPPAARPRVRGTGGYALGEWATSNGVSWQEFLAQSRVYEVRPRKDKRGVDLIFDVLPFGRLWYTKPDDAIGYASLYSRSHDAVIRVYDAAGNVVETHEHNGDFEPRRACR
jgi:hypothetical protein